MTGTLALALPTAKSVEVVVFDVLLCHGLNFFSNGTACKTTGGPGILKIKTAGDAVDIENFSGKVETRRDFALQGPHVDVIEFDPTTGDELVFVHAFPLHLKLTMRQLFTETIDVLFADL